MTTRTTTRRRAVGRGTALLAGALCALAGGCTWDRYHLFTPPPAPPGPVDDLVLRGDHFEPEEAPKPGSGAAELEGARDLYRRGDYATAERIFRHIADNTKNPPAIAEEARYYEAESLRMQSRYPKAADVYNRLLNDFPSGVHRDQAAERKFEIAFIWLDDTREDMRREKEVRDNGGWFVLPTAWVHFEKYKPLLDEEGRALEQLDEVVLSDLNGRRTDEALFIAGSVKFFREDYREADRYFSQLVDTHPNSKFASQAVELAIISKHMSTGGPDYDGRKVAEARKLVDSAWRNYPELAEKKADFLHRQLAGITQQQAEKDFNIAAFYEHQGHAGSAYFYYEIVRRRYPGTQLAERAAARMNELRAKEEKKSPGKVLPTPPPATSAPQAPAPQAAAPQLLPPPTPAR